MDTLFTSDLVALRKRRANVGAALRVLYDFNPLPKHQRRRLAAQYSRTFRHLTVVELRLTDKVTP